MHSVILSTRAHAEHKRLMKCGQREGCKRARSYKRVLRVCEPLMRLAAATYVCTIMFSRFIADNFIDWTWRVCVRVWGGGSTQNVCGFQLARECCTNATVNSTCYMVGCAWRHGADVVVVVVVVGSRCGAMYRRTFSNNMHMNTHSNSECTFCFLFLL